MDASVIRTDNMFRREITDRIREWKDTYDGRSCLLIEGARRVGKTTAAREFAKENYRSYALIDFSEPSSMRIRRMISEGFDDLDELFREISRIHKVRLYEHDSVIIFDEIQLFPKARELLKHLVADGRYDYIETGSPVTMRKEDRILNPSEEHPVRMYPMTFREFCWATGNDAMYDDIERCFADRVPMGRYPHEAAMRLFRTYMLVGGMPAAVSAFLETNDYASAEAVKSDILSLYSNDSEKLIPSRRIRGRRLFRSIPWNLASDKKTFAVAKLEKNGRKADYLDLVDSLDGSGMANVCYRLRTLDRAFDMYVDEDEFKIYMNDTGLLLTSSFGIDGSEDELYNAIIDDDLSVNEGMFFENAVSQELCASGHGLRYYLFYPRGSPTNIHEVDFILPADKGVTVIEVKSGKKSAKHASLDHLLEDNPKVVGSAYVIHSKDLRIDDKITYIPIYMTGLLRSMR